MTPQWGDADAAGIGPSRRPDQSQCKNRHHVVARRTALLLSKQSVKVSIIQSLHS